MNWCSGLPLEPNKLDEEMYEEYVGWGKKDWILMRDKKGQDRTRELMI